MALPPFHEWLAWLERRITYYRSVGDVGRMNDLLDKRANAAEFYTFLTVVAP